MNFVFSEMQDVCVSCNLQYFTKLWVESKSLVKQPSIKELQVWRLPVFICLKRQYKTFYTWMLNVTPPHCS